jgi:hypothetical protein
MEALPFSIVPSHPSLSSLPSASSDTDIPFFNPSNSLSQAMHPQGWLPQQKLFSFSAYISNKLSKSVGIPSHATQPNPAPEPDSTGLL